MQDQNMPFLTWCTWVILKITATANDPVLRQSKTKQKKGRSIKEYK